MGLGHSVLGDNTRIRLMTSVSNKPRKSPGGKAYVEDNRRLGLGCIDLGWSVSRDTGPR